MNRQNPPRQFIRSHFLNPKDNGDVELLRDGLLEVDAAGRIAGFGPCREENLPADAWERDLRDYLVIPGLIDLHTHLPQYEVIGMDGHELPEWLGRYIFPAEARFADPAHAHRIIDRFFDDLLAEGTTTASILGTIHAPAVDLMFRKAKDCGIRALIGKVLMDRNAPPELTEETDAALAASEELCRRWHGQDDGRLQYAFLPRFAWNCSRELMAGAGALASSCGAWIHTHLSENLRSIERTLAEFPECRNYVEIYARAGMLGSRSLMAHAIHLDDRERTMLRESGTGVAHCPSSNFFLKSGIMDIRSLDAAEIPFGLGSDVGAGPNLSVFSEMHSALNASKARAFFDRQSTVLSPERAFFLGTLGGARVLALDRETGSFQRGKSADYLVIDFQQIDPTSLGVSRRSKEEILSLLVYRADRACVRRTVIRGRRVHG